MSNNCIFCKIADKSIESHIVYENENLICFLDSDPINEGHVLIIPKNHLLDLDDLTDDMAVEIIHVSKIIVKALKSVYHADGYSIMQNGGIFNDIGHYHMHVFPRYKDDGFGWTSGDDIPQAWNRQTADKIANAIKSMVD